MLVMPEVCQVQMTEYCVRYLKVNNINGNNEYHWVFSQAELSSG